jgi:hypothetical protein
MPGGWWIPVLAAVVGLLGGVGGAYVGGEVANNGQEQQFENQRAAQVQDLLIDTYEAYARTAARTVVAVDAKEPNATQLIEETAAAQAVVIFEAPEDSNVEPAADELANAAVSGDMDEFPRALVGFTDAATESLNE